MPETIRTANERLRSRPRRGGFLAAFGFATLCSALSTPARADVGAAFSLVDDIIRAVTVLSRQQVTTLTLTFGLLCFAVLATIVLLRTRKAAATIETAVHDETLALRAEIDRLKTLLLSQPQGLVAWAAGHHMRRAVDTLRSDGRGFLMTLTTSAGRPLEAEGRAVAGRAVLRLRDVSGIESELMDLAARHDRLMGDVESMKTLLNSLPAPVWARNSDGQLIFVNAAYARAVDAEDASDAVERELELLDRAARAKLNDARAGGGLYCERLPAIAAGQHRIFDVVDAPSSAGSAGMAIDATEVEAMRAELARMIEAHRRVLDH